MISLELNNRINFYLTSLLAFFIPIHSSVPPILIGLIVINWLLNPSNILTSFKNLKVNYSLVSLIILFLVYFVGVLLSEDKHAGFKSVETILSFIILPLVFANYKSSIQIQIHQFLKIFVIGCITYAIICFAYATYAVLKPIQTDLYGVLYELGYNHFFYNYLSLYFHPSYTAMYSVFALLIIARGILGKKVVFNWQIVLAISLLTIFVLLLSSKAGWISLSFLIIYFSAHFLIKKQLIKILYFLVPIISFFMLFNVLYTPDFSKRLPQTEKIITAIKGEDKEKNEVTTFKQDGNASRVLIWKASLELIQENLWGFGTGDAKDKLLGKYQEKKMFSELESKLNSHNQYFTTALGIGFLGLVVLFFVLFFPLLMSLKNKEYILTGFIILLAMNFLFESMLETQNGVVFFAFFYSLLCVSYNEKIKA